MNLIVGPENAVYCQIKDPTGSVVSDKLGRCTIVVDRVSKRHNGTWFMTIGTPGRILTETLSFNVTVREPGLFHCFIIIFKILIFLSFIFTNN